MVSAAAVEFMTPPPPQAMQHARDKLEALGAVDERGELTDTGRKMAVLPLEPEMSRMVLAGVEFGCGLEAAMVAAAVSAEATFWATPPHWLGESVVGNGCNAVHSVAAPAAVLPIWSGRPAPVPLPSFHALPAPTTRLDVRRSLVQCMPSISQGTEHKVTPSQGHVATWMVQVQVKRSQFTDPDGDLVTYAKVLRAFDAEAPKHRVQWCRENLLHFTDVASAHCDLGQLLRCMKG